MGNHPYDYIKRYNISQERLGLYKDFICDLVLKVNETFLGDDIMTDEDKWNHFNWCWRKVIGEFREQRIYFDEECDLRDYLWDSFYNLYYGLEHDKNELKDNLLVMWAFTFDHKINKSADEARFALNSYNRFDKCLIV